MAYSTLNPPMKISQGPLDDTIGGPTLWAYRSVDAIATVLGAGYFTNGRDLGMEVGDLVYTFDITTPTLSIAWVKPNAAFTASVAANVMTVSAVAAGTLAVGQVLQGPNLAVGTTIVSQLTGSAGSTGTYQISVAQTISSQTIYGLALAINLGTTTVSTATAGALVFA